MADAFKFIHASDFHLDEPMRGLTELPTHLKSVLANAPYESASKIFDLAISERVDFVLLSGDLFDLEAGGPRAAAFLLSQFERLADRNIEVYWCAGAVDKPERWPTSIELPENVVTFSSAVVEDVTHRRDGTPLATIYGCGTDSRTCAVSDFIVPAEDAFPIALAYGEFDFSALPVGHGIFYWALGGRHKSSKLDKTGTVIAYPGTPQGRSPRETGGHGCNLCRVDNKGKLRIQFVETDTVRWLPQKVAIAENVSEQDLKNTLAERALRIATDATDQTVLTHWHLTTTGSFHPQLRHRERMERVLEWLRDEFGRGETGIWSTKLTADPPDNLPNGWYEEDTILGEYLRAVGRYQSDDSLNLSLHEYLPASLATEEHSAMGRVDSSKREYVLRKSALVGIEYLGAHKEMVDPAGEGTAS